MSSEEIFENLEKHVRATDDAELILLKGHLILEQSMNQLLLCSVQTNEALASLRLSFSRKLALLRALSPSGHPIHKQAPHLQAINRLRNKLAHQLEPPGLRADLGQWACDVVGYVPSTLARRGTYKNTVLKAFYLLVGYLCGVANMQGQLSSQRGVTSSLKCTID